MRLRLQTVHGLLSLPHGSLGALRHREHLIGHLLRLEDHALDIAGHHCLSPDTLRIAAVSLRDIAQLRHRGIHIPAQLSDVLRRLRRILPHTGSHLQHFTQECRAPLLLLIDACDLPGIIVIGYLRGSAEHDHIHHCRRTLEQERCAVDRRTRMHLSEHCHDINHIHHIDRAKDYGDPQYQLQIIVQYIDHRQREDHHEHKVILCAEHSKPVHRHVTDHRDMLEHQAVLFVKIDRIACYHGNDDRHIHSKHKAQADISLHIIANIPKKQKHINDRNDRQHKFVHSLFFSVLRFCHSNHPFLFYCVPLRFHYASVCL